MNFFPTTWTETTFFVLRFLAAMSGAILAWFLVTPFGYLFYRIAFHKPMPHWLSPYVRFLGAGVVGALVFFLIPIGGGGGLGFGPGAGGSPGAGAGKGSTEETKGKVASSGTADSNPKPPVKPERKVPTEAKKTTREQLDIELLGGAKYKGDQRFYLIGRSEPARTIAEVEDVLKQRQDSVVVHIILTDESVASQHEAVHRLRKVTNLYKIPTVEPTDSQ